MEPEVGPHSPDEDSAVPDQALRYQRSLKSLHMLATRFLEFLQEAEGGVVDLREVSGPRPVKHTAQQILSPPPQLFVVCVCVFSFLFFFTITDVFKCQIRLQEASGTAHILNQWTIVIF